MIFGKKKEDSKKNTFKGATVKTKKVAGPKKDIFGPLVAFFKKEKNKNVFGLLFMLISIYLFIAFTSYLFTWQEDQDKVNLGYWDLFGDKKIVVQNWLGKTGTIFSHLFMHSWFGISSFVFPFLFGLVGVRLFFKKSILPLRRSFKLGSIFLVWTSICLGFLFSDGEFFPGGSFGYQINSWLVSFIGTSGTGVLIFFVLAAILVINFNVSFEMIKALFEKEEVEDDLAENIVNTEIPVNTIKEDPSTQNIDIVVPPDLSSESKSEVVEDLPIAASNTPDDVAEPASDNTPSEEPVVELNIEEKKPDTKKSDADELELAVEETIEKEEVLSQSEINKKVEEFGEYDPTLDLGSYTFPGVALLKDYGDGGQKVTQEELEVNKNSIVETLRNYNIEISKIKATIGPTITLYEIVPAPGVRISKIKNLEDDIALSLAALGIRIIAPIPGRGTIGIEVPNSKPDIVSMHTAISSKAFQNSEMELPIALGKTIQNETFVVDLAKMPHLLMAGATGQGKSVGLNAILVSLLYKKHPAQLKLVLVDPKKVELTLFNKVVRHFLAKLPDSEEAIITETKKVVNTVNSLCIEMDQRYEMLKNAHCRNIKEYNAKFIARKLNPENGHKFLPYIVLVIDEFADLIMTAGKEIETPIARLAQLARAIGIHLIVATQRPSVNIITGTIKANFPARVAFRVTSKIDSRTILDAGGADQLIGRGDMLFTSGNDLIRLQCAFVDTPEVEEICEFIGGQRGYADAFLLPEYVDPDASGSSDEIDLGDRDALFEDAARIVITHQQGSASLLQRRLKLGYNRAGRIIDQLEAAGIVGPFEGSKARQVLFPDEYSLEQYLNNQIEEHNNNGDS